MNQLNQIPDMRGIIETAQNFGISAHYARQLALSGTVAAVRIGKGKILICQQSVAEYFNNSRIPNDAPEQLFGGIRPIPVKIGGDRR